jgi:hypothetical protein
MKAKINLIITALLFLFSTSEVIYAQGAKFEIDFAESHILRHGITFDDSTSVLITGYLTFAATANEVKALQSEEASKYRRNIVLAPDSSHFRLYTFLRDASVEYEGKRYTANENGVVRFELPVDVSKIKILGKEIPNSGGRIAGGGQILSSYYQYGDRRIAVFYLGEKESMR